LDRPVPSSTFHWFASCYVVIHCQPSLPYPETYKTQMKLPLTRDKYYTTVTCGGNSVGNSTENSLDKQKQNKDSLTKGYKKDA